MEGGAGNSKSYGFAGLFGAGGGVAGPGYSHADLAGVPRFYQQIATACNNMLTGLLFPAGDLDGEVSRTEHSIPNVVSPAGSQSPSSYLLYL